jgi:hypothetical protein
MHFQISLKVMKAVFKSLVNENVKSPKKRRQSLKYTNKDEALTVMLEVLTEETEQKQ